MDAQLCDEVLQEIFRRLPPTSSAAVSLVSKRWRRLLRSSTTSLTLNFPPPCETTTLAAFSSFLSDHPFLSSISLSNYRRLGGADPLVLAVAASCPNLRQLSNFSDPVTPTALCTLAASCSHLSSISVCLARPASIHWVPCFKSLTRLSLSFSSQFYNLECEETKYGAASDQEFNLESLSLYGLRSEDRDVSYLWRNCKNLKKFELTCCYSFDVHSTSLKFMNALQELELIACCIVANLELLKMAIDCPSLKSLLMHDGGSREGLLQFFNQSKCSLRRLDLSSPVDFDNTHLLAFAQNPNFSGLVSLSLADCNLASGEGLKAVCRAVGNAIEELNLINCDVVGREWGLLAALGQDLKRLRKLDLSFNDMVDMELVSMLVYCDGLDELRLRECHRLSAAAMVSMVKSCRKLQVVDVSHCSGIGEEGVEFVVTNALLLRRMEVEPSKVTPLALALALAKRHSQHPLQLLYPFLFCSIFLRENFRVIIRNPFHNICCLLDMTD